MRQCVSVGAVRRGRVLVCRVWARVVWSMDVGVVVVVGDEVGVVVGVGFVALGGGSDCVGPVVVRRERKVWCTDCIAHTASISPTCTKFGSVHTGLGPQQRNFLVRICFHSPCPVHRTRTINKYEGSKALSTCGAPGPITFQGSP